MTKKSNFADKRIIIISPVTRQDLAILVIIAILYSTLVFAHGAGAVGLVDWDFNLKMAEVIRRSIVLFREPPLWNPYSLGGVPVLFHPQYLLSPLWHLGPLLFGTVAGMKMTIILHYSLGAAGMVLVSGRLGFGRAGTWGSTLAFVLSPLHAWHLVAGEAVFLGLFLLPWLFLFLLDAGTSFLHSYLAGIVVLLMVIGLSPVMFIPVALFLGVWAAGESLRTGSARPLAGFVGAFLMGGLFSLFKTLYSFELLSRYGGRHIVEKFQGLTFSLLPYALFYPEKATVDINAGGVDIEVFIWEISVYVGIPVAILAFTGIYAQWRRHWPLILAGAVCVLLAAGTQSTLSPFPLLGRLPVLDELRVPSRFRVGLFFPLCLFAGMGAANLAGRSRFRLLSMLLPALAAADLLFAGVPLLYNAFPIPAEKASLGLRPGPFRQVGYIPNSKVPLAGEDWITPPISWRQEFFLASANIGVIRNYDPGNWPLKPKGEGDRSYRGEMFLNGPGNLKTVDWTPRSVEVKVRLDAPGTVFLNQNWDPGWHAKMNGREVQVSNRLGLVSLEAPKGESNVRIYYFPYEWLSTLATSLASLLLLGYLACRK